MNFAVLIFILCNLLVVSSSYGSDAEICFQAALAMENIRNSDSKKIGCLSKYRHQMPFDLCADIAHTISNSDKSDGEKLQCLKLNSPGFDQYFEVAASIIDPRKSNHAKAQYLQKFQDQINFFLCWHLSERMSGIKTIIEERRNCLQRYRHEISYQQCLSSAQSIQGTTSFGTSLRDIEVGHCEIAEYQKN